MLDGERVGSELVAIVRGYLAKETATLRAEIDALKGLLTAQASGIDLMRKSIASIPAGVKGDPGEKGERGEKGADAVIDEDRIVARLAAIIPPPEKGESGMDGANGRDGADGRDGKDGRDGVDGKDGADGVNGKDADEDAIVERVLAAMPKPKDGKDGKDVDEDAIVQRILALVPVPKDGRDGIDGKDGKAGDPGESVHPDTVSLMVREAVDVAVGKAISGVRLPKDGEPGRDAVEIDPLEHLDGQRSYPIGTYAKWRGGLIKAARNTDPIDEGFAKSGWVVVLEGIADVAAEWVDERTAELRIERTSGEASVVRKTWPVLIDRGVYRAGVEYRAGDGVTWGGSFWICQSDTTDKPGTSAAWRLAVKHGRDGRDAK